MHSAHPQVVRPRESSRKRVDPSDIFALISVELWLESRNRAYQISPVQTELRQSFDLPNASFFLRRVCLHPGSQSQQCQSIFTVMTNIPPSILWTYSLQTAYSDYPGASAAYWESVIQWARAILLQPRSARRVASHLQTVTAAMNGDISSVHARTRIAIDDYINPYGAPRTYIIVSGMPLV
ncbi:hypothetical protein Hypma_013465 [Hypsizygus marmoreus]|uniref:Uncharacterized protein n=1 Tax=Hypsizygus marmoreus TaxID=39966 RepID=A0A369JFZ5_HYPMA|nr:hypothetical protein Hypma_013465 [Hypsizygus marmoreus]